MANNRLFLVCTTCKPANGSPEILLLRAQRWSCMIAKYYPGTGWYLFHDDHQARLEKFLEQHSHGTQWGANIVSELEIAEDEK
jgi:hypothetical protein